MKIITFGSSFLSPEELTQLFALLLMVAGFLIMIGFRKADFAMIGGGQTGMAATCAGCGMVIATLGIIAACADNAE